MSFAEAYAAADAFVSASDTETFGNVYLEALAGGLPAVVAGRGGVRETVLPGRTGIRVPPGDVRGFADACAHLLTDVDERARPAAGPRAEALSRRWDTILDGVLDAYAEVAAGADRAGAARPN